MLVGVVCGRPADGKNTVPVPNPFTSLFEMNYTYTCQCGYMPQGEMTATCQANGTWSLPPPECIGKSLKGRSF